ncbi:hypothetical protein [Streptomyces sp. NPDC059991]|uniref:hypothetical protein n=1 Tax=unclassified Streptomyces TaxID=2593676 RepID=UPI0036CB564C
MNGQEAAREHPYEPEPGAVVRDAQGRVGRFVGRDYWGHHILRPLRGGREWDAGTGELRPAAQSDVLSEAVREANARSQRQGRA